MSPTSSEQSNATPSPTEPPKAPDNPYYEIRPIPGKGYGCIAKQPLKRGTRILTDSPLLTVSQAHYLLSDLEAAFAHLTPSQKALYFSLASAHGQDPKQWPTRFHASLTGRDLQRIQEQHTARISPSPSLVSIFQTNCMEMGKGAGVFPHAARFNHSCNPNANFTWNAKIGQETVHIINDVAQDEEITFSYVDMAKEKSLRSWELKHYGFVCKCRACAGDEDERGTFAHESAERRFRIAELERATRYLRGKRIQEGAKQLGFVKQLLELAGLHKEEGDYSVRLAHIYLDLARVCEIAQDSKHGVECAANAVRVKRECQGEDSPDYDKYVVILRRLHAKLKASSSA